MTCGYYQLDKAGNKINQCQREAMPGHNRCKRHYTSGGLLTNRPK